MNNSQWRTSFLIVLVILVGLAAVRLLAPRAERVAEAPALDVSTERVPEAVTQDVGAYFPAFVGLTYHFAGEGMEFASFARRIAFASAGLIQVEELSGTNLAQVFELSESELKVLWSQEEFYRNESLLDNALAEGAGPGRRENLILLQAPLKVGNSWADSRFRREIVGMNEVVTVPLGTFHAVIVVKSVPLGSENEAGEEATSYEYYAKNMGLIQRETVFGANGETYSVISKLQSISSVFDERG